MMSLEGPFEDDTTAFADPLHSVIEVRGLELDLQLEAFVGAHVTRYLTAAAAAAVKKPVVGLVRTATESVTSTVGMIEVVLADLALTTNLMDFVEVVAAFEPCSVASYAHRADLIACLSYLTEYHASVVAVVQKHYFEVLTAAAANLIGCFADSLTAAAAAAAAAAMVESACLIDCSAAHATLIAGAAAAACPQHCSVLVNSAACLKNSIVD